MADIKGYDPSGKKVSIPQDQLETAQRFGYRVATPEDLETERLQEKYGGVSDTVLGALTGAASGALFGLPEIAIAKLGGREWLQGVQKLHPELYTGAKIAGAIAPAIATFGAAAPESAASIAATGAEAAAAARAAQVAEAASAVRSVGTAAKIARGAGRAVTALPRAADAAGAAVQSALGLAKSPILGAGVRGLTSSGLESFVQGAGDKAGQLAIDNKLSAESFLPIVMAGVDSTKAAAPVGLGLGLLGGAVGVALNKTGDKLRKAALAGVPEISPNATMREATAAYAAKAKGADPSMAARLAVDEEAMRVARMADTEIDKVVPDFDRDITEAFQVADRTSDFTRDSTKKFGAVRHKLPRGEILGDDGIPTTWQERQVREFESIAQPIESDLAQITNKENRFEFSQFQAKPLQKRIDKARARIAAADEADRGLIAAEEMNRLKQTIDKGYKRLRNSQDILAQNTSSLWGNWGESLRASLMKEEVFGDVAKFQRAMNKGAEAGLDALDNLKGEWLVKYGKSPVDWTRRNYRATGAKVKTNLLSTSDAGTNISVESLRDWLNGQEQTWRTLKADGALTMSELADVNKGLELANRLRSNLDKATEIAQLGATYKKLATGTDPLFAVAAGAMVGPLAILAAPMLKPAIALRGLELANRVANKQNGKIAAGVNAAMRAVRQTARGAPATVGTMVGKYADVERKAKLTREMATQLPQLDAEVKKQVGWMADTAPTVEREIRASFNRAISYLNANVPGSPAATTPFSRPIPPTKQELVSFEKRYAAVKNPNVLLDDLASGKLSPETVEAVRTVYPEMFAQVQTQLLEQVSQMAARGERPSMASRVQLSLVFGVPLTPEMDPESIRMFQSIYAQQTPEQRQGGVSPQRAPNFAANYESGAQETATAQ